MKTKNPPKGRPVRLRCTKAPKCKRGRWIAMDDLMPLRTVAVEQPCDRHEQPGYYDLQITYYDKDGVALEGDR